MRFQNLITRLALSLGLATVFVSAADVSIKNILVKVNSKAGESIASERIAYPQSSTTVFEVKETDKFTVSFDLTSAGTPEQVAVRLSEVDGKDRSKTIKAGMSDGKYTAIMDFGTKRGPKMQAGVYSVDILVGGLKITPLIWTAGKVAIASNFKRKAKSGNVPLETLEYTFSKGFEVPSSTMGFIFTLIVLLPFVGLFSAWRLIGVNMKQFNPSLSSLVFHSSLAAMYALFIWFWVELNMYTTIIYFMPIGLVMFLSGNKTLKNLKMR
eukprot:CFRG4257T1